MAKEYPRLNIRVDKEFYKKVEDWRRKQPVVPTMSATVRFLVERGIAVVEAQSK